MNIEKKLAPWRPLKIGHRAPANLKRSEFMIMSSPISSPKRLSALKSRTVVAMKEAAVESRRDAFHFSTNAVKTVVWQSWHNAQILRLLMRGVSRASVLMLAFSLFGCASQTDGVRSGAYIAYRIQQDRPQWVANHAPCCLDDAAARVYHDCQNGQRLSQAIAKECQ